MTTTNLKFRQRNKIRKKTGKHSKQRGPKEKPVSKYRGQGRK